MFCHPARATPLNQYMLAVRSQCVHETNESRIFRVVGTFSGQTVSESKLAGLTMFVLMLREGGGRRLNEQQKRGLKK